jgi:hypothetical protein
MQRIAGYIVTTGALIMATSALASTAGVTPAEQACLDAFMKNLAEKYQPAPRLREARFDDDLGTTAAENRGESWYLTATNPRNNRIVARATCLFNGSEAEVEILRSSDR